MKKAAKSLLLRCLDILGVNGLFRICNRNKALILYYHGICGENFTLLKDYDERHIAGQLFRKQLEYLKRHGYVFVSMTELINALDSKANVGKYVVLTFDDGFRNVLKNAYPLMRESNARGCFYLVSELVGKKQLLWTDYIETVIRNWSGGDFEFIYKGEKTIYMIGDKRSSEHAMRDIKAKLRNIPDKERCEHLTQFSGYRLSNIPEEFLMAGWEEIRELDQKIIEIGGHTKSHPDCENLITDDELEREILGSKMEIEKELGRKVVHFCYPAGSYNDGVVNKVKEYGYLSAVTTDAGFVDRNTDLFRLKRIVTGNDFQLFKANISGSYPAIHKALRILGVGATKDS